MSSKTIVRVREVMTQQFVILDGIATVEEGIQALLKKDAHAVIIQRRCEEDEYGIVVLPDIAQKVLSVDKAPERVNLYEIMTKPVLAVDPELDIRYCARLFYRFGLSMAPVIQDKEVLGIVTYNDIVLRGLLKR